MALYSIPNNKSGKVSVVNHFLDRFTLPLKSILQEIAPVSKKTIPHHEITVGHPPAVRLPFSAQEPSEQNPSGVPSK
jgi:hypothetical protein